MIKHKIISKGIKLQISLKLRGAVRLQHMRTIMSLYASDAPVVMTAPLMSSIGSLEKYSGW